MTDLIVFIARFDTILFGLAALVLIFIVLAKRQRPLTRQRVMDVGLSAILFVAMGVRFFFLAGAILLFPTAVLGGASINMWLAVGACLVAGLVGIITHRGHTPRRAFGAFSFAAANLTEAVIALFVVSAPAGLVLDTLAGVVLAAATLVMAAFVWSHRAATPNPLDPIEKPFDY